MGKTKNIVRLNLKNLLLQGKSVRKSIFYYFLRN